MAIHINDPSSRADSAIITVGAMSSTLIERAEHWATRVARQDQRTSGSGSGSPSRRLEIEGQTVIKYLQSCASEGVVYWQNLSLTHTSDCAIIKKEPFQMWRANKKNVATAGPETSRKYHKVWRTGGRRTLIFELPNVDNITRRAMEVSAEEVSAQAERNFLSKLRAVKARHRPRVSIYRQ